MITVFNALSWLSKFDDSHLSLPARALSNAARRVDRSDHSVIQMLDRLQNLSLISKDPLEVTELLMHRAVVEHWHRWFVQSIRHTKEAVVAYKKDDHRRAVALWILGLSRWEILQNHKAYLNWNEARRIFQERQFFYQHLPNEEEWYTRRLWQMELDLAAKPEEILTWLNCFEDTNLTPFSQQAVLAAQEMIRQRMYPDVYTCMQDLQEVNRWSRDLHERSETFLEYGLAAHEMGNRALAIELLKKSVADFPAGNGANHKQVIARCMLGAIEWFDPCDRNQATIDWRRCIQEFEELRLRADKDNDQTKKKWYADHRAILEAALSERLPTTQPPRRTRGQTHATSLAPGPEPPSDPTSVDGLSDEVLSMEEHVTESEQSHVPAAIHHTTTQTHFSVLYEELVTMVHGDRATADRLIEYERKRFPNESPTELIRRAIDRLLDDRR